MMREEMKKTIHMIFLFATAILVGCSSDVQDQSELATTATFDITAISGVKVDDIGEASKGLWSEIPQKRSITFRACLNDVTLQVPLHSQNVQVRTPFADQSKTTDSAGCLTWSDDFDFSYFSKEQLVQYPISITGLSGHMGHEEVTLVVNPWNQDSSKVVYDTRYDELPEVITTQRESSSSVIQMRNLSISYVQSGYNSSEKFAFYSFRLNAQVEGRRSDIKGNPVSLPLQKGQFQIELDLIEEKESEYSKISHTAIVADLEEGILSKNIQFNFIRGFQHHPDSRFYVNVSFKPIGLPKSAWSDLDREYLNHKGILPLANLQGANEGALDSLSLYPSALVASEFKTQSLIKEASRFEGSDDEKTYQNSQDETITDNFGVSIASVNLTNGVLLTPEDNRLNARVRRMPITICLADGLSQNSNKPLPLTKIAFKGRQGTRRDTQDLREATTDQGGCFQSYILMAYDYLGCERFDQFTYEVEVKDGRYRGLRKTASLAINPYNPQDLFYDLRLASAPPAIECQAPSIAINQFTYRSEGTDRNSFKVNRHLHMSLAKRFSIEFSPKFYRNGSYQEIENHNNLYAGEFEMTATVLAPKNPHADYFQFNEAEWDYLSSSKKAVSINSNGIVADEILMPFHLSETLFLSYKNLLLVQLKPMKRTNLKATTFMLPFYATSQNATLMPSIVEEAFSLELGAKIAQTLRVKGKLPGMHRPTQQSSDLLGSSPIELYREKLRSLYSNREKTTNLLYGDLDFFNSLPPVASKDWADISAAQKLKYKTTLSVGDMRILTGYQGEKTERLLQKF
jgi:hypothetical protein